MSIPISRHIFHKKTSFVKAKVNKNQNAPLERSSPHCEWEWGKSLKKKVDQSALTAEFRKPIQLPKKEDHRKIDLKKSPKEIRNNGSFDPTKGLGCQLVKEF